MNRQLNLTQVRQLLNRSAMQLDEHTLTGLRQARTCALERHAEHAHTLAFSGSHRPAHWSPPAAHRKAYLWVGAILLVACVVTGSLVYLHKTTATDNSDVDIAILTSDLPLKVFLD